MKHLPRVLRSGQFYETQPPLPALHIRPGYLPGREILAASATERTNAKGGEGEESQSEEERVFFYGNKRGEMEVDTVAD